MGILERARFKKELLASQWLSRQELRAVQLQRVKLILSHAYANVPFYKRRFKEASVDIDAIQTLSDLRKVPTLSKEDLRSTPPEQMVPAGVKLQALGKVSTSGTAGPPIAVYFDETALSWRQACTDRVEDAIGLDPWDRDAVLHFSSSKDKDQASLQLRMKRLALTRRQRYVRPFYFTYSCEEILAELIKYKPAVVEGQPAYLRELKNALMKAHKVLKLKLLISSGDILDNFTRKELESFFRCPVYEVYGAQDVGPLAWQCKVREGHHVNAEINYQECVDEKGEECAVGEAGEIAVTCLDNYSFPLIRYKVGDVISFDAPSCECGRTLPLLRKIEGRRHDFITLPVSGKKVSPRIIVSAVREIPDLPRFQLVGTSRNEARLRIFSSTLSEHVAKEAAAKCTELFGGEIVVSGERVKQEARAKVRAVVPWDAMQQ